MSALRKALRAAASPLAVLPQANGWQRQYVFAANSIVFAGHFPEHPVLPGVTQILMAQMTLEDALDRPLDLSAITQAKFTMPLEPGALIELRVQQGRRLDLWDCSMYCAGNMASRFQLETKPESG